MITETIPNRKILIQRLNCLKEFFGQTLRKLYAPYKYWVARLGANQKSVYRVRLCIPLTFQYLQNKNRRWNTRSSKNRSHAILCSIEQVDATQNLKAIRYAKYQGEFGSCCKKSLIEPELWCQIFPSNTLLNSTSRFLLSWKKQNFFG